MNFKGGKETVVVGTEVLCIPLKIIVIPLRIHSPEFNDLLLCNKLPHNVVTWNNNLWLPPTFCGLNGLEWLLLGMAHAPAVRCYLGLESSEVSTGLDINIVNAQGWRLMLAVIWEVSRQPCGLPHVVCSTYILHVVPTCGLSMWFGLWNLNFDYLLFS